MHAFDVLARQSRLFGGKVRQSRLFAAQARWSRFFEQVAPEKRLCCLLPWTHCDVDLLLLVMMPACNQRLQFLVREMKGENWVRNDRYGTTVVRSLNRKYRWG